MLTKYEEEEICKKLRLNIIKMGNNFGGVCHYGGSLSTVEIIYVLYKYVMNIDITNPNDPKRDRFILSKGHGSLGLYTVLNHIGVLSDEEMMTYKLNGTKICLHPHKNPEKFIEISSGSLGQGLSFGVGTAVALKKKNISSKVFVLLGDGECNEGSIWEACFTASQQKLNNLVIIIDSNGLIQDCNVQDVMNVNIKEMFDVIGFETYEIDGHDVNSLYDKLSQEQNKPLCIIAKTVKGKGISFMENQTSWHSKKLTKAEFDLAMKELGE